MTKQQFEQQFDIVTHNSPAGSPLVYMTVQARDKATGNLINVTRFQLTDVEIRNMVMDTAHSLVPFTSEYIIDKHRRYALDMLATTYGIADWYPLNNETDISMY